MKQTIGCTQAHRANALGSSQTVASIGLLQRQINESSRLVKQHKHVTACQRKAVVLPGTNKQIIQRITVDEANSYVNNLTSPDYDPGYTLASDKLSGSDVRAMLEDAEMAAWHSRAYHATKSHKVDSILNDGLDPNRGGTGASSGNETFERNSEGKVHYTRNMDTAQDYQLYFSGEGSPFGSRKDAHPAPAEILAINLPQSIRSQEEVDPDMPKELNAAFRVGVSVPEAAVRSMAPVPIPSVGNPELWTEHQRKGIYENDALFSNLSEETQTMINDLVEQGLDKQIIIHSLKQGLLSMPARNKATMKKNIRARFGLANRVTAMGEFIRKQL